jgi:hypothetical protein
MDLGPELLVIDPWNFKGFLDLKLLSNSLIQRLTNVLCSPEANKCAM